MKVKSRPGTRAMLAATAVLTITCGIGVMPAANSAEVASECAWMDQSLPAAERARLLVDSSTLEQNLRWLAEQTAVVADPTQCTPGIAYTDGPQAISWMNGVTVYPSPIALASTWDSSLNWTKGQQQAAESFDKQRNVLLAPSINIERVPFNGRTSEYMGEDPALTGDLAASYIRGVQEGNPDKAVMSTVKHYLGNQQETHRYTSSSNIDERTIRELYTPAFQDAVRKGHPGSVMCAYNKVNGTQACENEEMIDILKDDIGFQGFLMSDFNAVWSTEESINSGLDQELNKPVYLSADRLKTAIESGEVSEARVKDAAFRVVSAYMDSGLFDTPLPGTAAADVRTAEHLATAKQIGLEGSVLLKNENALLPLNAKAQNQKIALIGPTATSWDETNNGVNASTPCSYLNPVVFCDVNGAATPFDQFWNKISGVTGSEIVYDSGSDPVRAAAVAADADYVVVLGHYTEGEFTDRESISLDSNGDETISAVAAANPNTAVVLQTGGPVLMPWADDVKAILQTYYGGEELGSIIADLVFGDANPSGRTANTYPRSIDDLPTAGSVEQYPGTWIDGTPLTEVTEVAEDASIRVEQDNPNAQFGNVEYTEGLEVGYRWYESQGIDPLFSFGHGLSYTTFDSAIKGVTRLDGGSVSVTVDVANTGNVAGKEVVELYVQFPEDMDQPSRLLKSFDKTAELAPGESTTIELVLTPWDFASWNTDADHWKISGNEYTLQLGRSVNDIVQQEPVTLEASVIKADTTAVRSTATVKLDTVKGAKEPLVSFAPYDENAGEASYTATVGWADGRESVAQVQPSRTGEMTVSVDTSAAPSGESDAVVTVTDSYSGNASTFTVTVVGELEPKPTATPTTEPTATPTTEPTATALPSSEPSPTATSSVLPTSPPSSSANPTGVANESPKPNDKNGLAVTGAPGTALRIIMIVGIAVVLVGAVLARRRRRHT